MLIDPHGAARSSRRRIARRDQTDAPSPVGGVGASDGVVDVGVADDGIAAELLVDERGAVLDVGDDGGAVEVRAEFGRPPRRSRCGAARASSTRPHDVELLFQRPSTLPSSSPGPSASLRHVGEGRHLLVQGVVDVQPLERGAGLPRVDEHPQKRFSAMLTSVPETMPGSLPPISSVRREVARALTISRPVWSIR